MELEGKRDSWEFQYSIAELLRGAIAQRDFRAGRLAWWESQKERVLAEAKEKGLIINESVADEAARGGAYAMGVSNTRGAGPSIGVDPKYQSQTYECQQKIAYHRQMFEIYDGWVQLLSKQPGESTRQLLQADWLFFFGKVDPYI